MVVFSNIFSEPAKTKGKDGRLTIDAAHLEAHLTAASLLGRFPDRMYEKRNSKRHAACDYDGKPLLLTLTEG